MGGMEAGRTEAVPAFDAGFWFERMFALRRRLSARPLLAYGTALLLVGVVMVYRVSVRDPHPAPFLTVFPAIIAASLLCGRGPGYVAASGIFVFAWDYVEAATSLPSALATSGRSHLWPWSQRLLLKSSRVWAAWLTLCVSATGH